MPTSFTGVRAIASSTNATPIVVTFSAGHGLLTGATIAVTGHLVNTAANGQWVVTVTSGTTLTLTGSVGNGVGGATGNAYVFPTSMTLPSDGDVRDASSVAVPFEGLQSAVQYLLNAGGTIRTQVFIASGTFTRPPGANFAVLIGYGGGGGGGGGQAGVVANTSSAGGGGGGGSIASTTVVALAAASYAVVVGAGGTSGAGGTAGGNGVAGGDGGDTTFGGVVTFVGGFGGGPGLLTVPGQSGPSIRTVVPVTNPMSGAGFGGQGGNHAIGHDGWLAALSGGSAGGVGGAAGADVSGGLGGGGGGGGGVAANSDAGVPGAGGAGGNGSHAASGGHVGVAGGAGTFGCGGGGGGGGGANDVGTLATLGGGAGGAGGGGKLTVIYIASPFGP